MWSYSLGKDFASIQERPRLRSCSRDLQVVRESHSHCNKVYKVTKGKVRPFGGSYAYDKIVWYLALCLHDSMVCKLGSCLASELVHLVEPSKINVVV